MSSVIAGRSTIVATETNMTVREDELLVNVWALDSEGRKVHPYKGSRGNKQGCYSVNFTNDTKNFQAMTEKELIRAIVEGRFRDRGTIRMRRPNDGSAAKSANAFAPRFYLGKSIKDL